MDTINVMATTVDQAVVVGEDAEETEPAVDAAVDVVGEADKHPAGASNPVSQATMADKTEEQTNVKTTTHNTF